MNEAVIAPYLAENERLRTENERLRAALEAFYDDAAILAGVAAVRRMLVLRVGDLRQHAEAFREAAFAAARDGDAT